MWMQVSKFFLQIDSARPTRRARLRNPIDLRYQVAWISADAWKPRAKTKFIEGNDVISRLWGVSDYASLLNDEAAVAVCG